MKTFISKHVVLVLLFELISGFIMSQTFEIDINRLQEYLDNEKKPQVEINQSLDFTPSNKNIDHVFHITMSQKDFKKLSKANIEKDYLSDCILTYNSDTISLKEIELRGKSSMCYKRKSYSIKLNDKIAFTKNGTTFKFKKINLISLSMDKNYYRNKVAFDLMNTLGLFNLFYDYAEVIINDKSQGVYLILQKPKNYAFKREKSNFMLRRDYESLINKTYYKDADTTLKVKCEEAFFSIYEEIIKKNGQSFYDELSEILDVEQYLTWMAFNYLIGNKDYTDEVFFYNKGGNDSIKFGVIPWDYDDVFFDIPHEGYLVRYINFGDKLAFSSEDDLDYKIIKDEYAYKEYLKILAKVTEKISIELLKETFQSTYQELYPFYCKKDILKISKTDMYGKTDLNSLEVDMQNNFRKIASKIEETTNALSTHLAEMK